MLRCVEGSIVVVLLSSCGSGGVVADGSTISGKISITGSSTVGPISSVVGEKFRDANPLADPSVEEPGTGDGFRKFCAGEFDIVDASRPIKDPEAAICSEEGIDFVELEIGRDALTLMTDDSHDDVSCLTFADVYGLVGPESDDVELWSDALSHGATSDLPDAALRIYAPGHESGTYDALYDLALASIAKERLGSENKRKTRSFDGLADDNQIVEGITGFATSFGWAGFAYADRTAGVRRLEVDGGKGCVAPTRENVENGTYPLSRGLFIYVNLQRASSNSAVTAFVDYYLSDEGMATVAETGYIPLTASDLESSRSTWRARG